MPNYKIPKDFTGEGAKLDPNAVSKTQLEMGIQIEMEHTHNRALAKRIALDHLAENPRYYTYLKRMEREMRVDALKKKQQKSKKSTNNTFGNQKGLDIVDGTFKQKKR